MDAREWAARARKTAEWKAKPWPTISARQVDWRSLSPTSCETLAMIAMPVALGFSYAEIAAQAGLSHAEVAQRMRNLRASWRLRSQQDGRRDPASRRRPTALELGVKLASGRAAPCNA
jgi:hypothetical protein